jgi:antitoxin HicB
MTPNPMTYPFILEKEGRTYAAIAAQFPALATSTSRKDVLERASRTLAVYLFEQYLSELLVPKPLAHDQLDLSDFVDSDFEIVDIEPLPTNPCSLELAKMIEASGLTQSEIAKRMGTTQSTVSRLADPFYWNHSLSSLERLAKAVGQTVEIRFSKAA